MIAQRMIPRLTTLLVLAGSAMSAWASEPTAGGHGADAPGLLSPDPGAAVWTIVVFALVVLVLRIFAWKPMLGALAKREENIRSSLDEAASARKMARETEAQRQDLIEHARHEAHEIIEEGRRDKVALLKKLEADHKTELGHHKQQAERELLLAKNQALHELLERQAQLSIAIASKIIDRALTVEDHQALIRAEVEHFRAQQG